jgi:hypothetical protein
LSELHHYLILLIFSIMSSKKFGLSVFQSFAEGGKIREKGKGNHGKEAKGEGSRRVEGNPGRDEGMAEGAPEGDVCGD